MTIATSEQVAIGRMLLAATSVDVVVAIAKAGDYERPIHSDIHNVIVGLHEAGQPCDAAAVLRHFRDNGRLRHIENGAYLHTCIEAAGGAGDDAYHARLIADAGRARRIRQTLDRNAARAADTSDADAVAQAAIEELTAAATTTDNTIETKWDVAIDGALQRIEAVADNPNLDRVPTGFADLDRILGGGLKGGQVVVIAGRPGMGKSVLAMNLVVSAAFINKIPTLVWSLEMNTDELVNRLAANLARVPLHGIDTGNLTDADWIRLGRFVGEYEQTPLWIDDRSTVDISHLRTRARHHARVNGLGLVVIDYLQLLEIGNSENRQVGIAMTTRALKNLARELSVPIVLVAQLNRGPEQRTDKRPLLADLRESGAVEQDADIIVFAHRDDYYDKASPRAGEADLIVAKNRSGPTDTVTVAAQLHFARFVDMAIP